MATARHDAAPGLREVWALWGLLALDAAAVFATYARLPVHELYHVSGSGRTAGAGRVLVLLNFPVALAAIGLVAVAAAQARSRAISRLAVVAVVLCAAVAWPGIVDQADLDAKWPNAIAAAGVLLALGLTIVATRREGLGPRTRVPGDRVRIVAAIVLVLISLPWIAADLGLVIGRWPVFRWIFYSTQWYAPFGHARLHQAVHAGHHHGLDGMLLGLEAIFISRTLGRIGPPLRRILGIYLGVMLVYGLAAVANDFWYEQLIKRGITNWEVPLLLVPMLNMQWLILLAIAAGTYILFFRRVSAGTPTGNRRLIWPLVLPLPVIGLLAVGLAHGARQHATTFGSVDGIAFVLATTSGSHVFVTRGGSLVQLTYGSHSELAPAWSPDGRRLAFQSNRDGNWEIYVADADGSHVRRLTHGDARDGEPAWSGDGRRIDFVRSGRLYSMQADGTAARALGIDGAWPSLSPDGKSLAYDVEFGGHHGIVVEQSGRALRLDVHDGRRPVWSPRGDLIAYQCRLGAHWRICVLNPRTGALRFLTGHDSDAFAPSWSPDGSRIAFLSDRDGNDQLYAMRADGGAVVRLTSGQADKDTPAWRP